MSIGYTKLFSSIVTSTIWVESDRTRIVWITMLALADRNGEIQASIPGLARLAGVPIPDCEEAIAKFTAPDPYSRTPDDQGRRIEKIEGGWALLNHAKYREMASRDESKAANAERQHRHREKAKRNDTVTPSNALVTKSNATVTKSNAEVTHPLHIAEAEAEKDNISESATAELALESEQAFDSDSATISPVEIYSVYPRKTKRPDALRAIAKAIIESGLTAQALLEVTQAYAKATDQWPKDQRKFIPYPASWFNGERYRDDPKEWESNAISDKDKSEYNSDNAF